MALSSCFSLSVRAFLPYPPLTIVSKSTPNLRFLIASFIASEFGARGMTGGVVEGGVPAGVVDGGVP